MQYLFHLTFLLGILIVCCTGNSPRNKRTTEEDPEDDNEDGDADTTKPKIILILIDGVRWDYIDRDPTLRGFHRLTKEGVRAQHVEPVFPSNSYPNWYSISTGLYPESHGFIQNNMYDERHNDFFLMLPHQNATAAHWWNKAEPFWILCEREGLKTALYWWGGCHVEFKGVKPTICVEHTGWDTPNGEVEEYLDKSLDKLNNDELDVVALYYGAVDHYGHMKGPDARETREALAEFDKILDELLDNITKEDMDDEVNVIIVSDHGMTKTSRKDVKFIDLEPFSKLIRFQLNSGASSMIMPVHGKEEQLYEQLFRANFDGLRLYKKDKLPEDYHIRKSSLVLPIWLQADKGYYIKPLRDSQKSMTSPTAGISLGSHGYDPRLVEDMMTIFYAKGPAFRKGVLSPALVNVDYYNLICHILDIKPLPNNGSMDRLSDVLRKEGETDDDSDDDGSEGDEPDEGPRQGPQVALVAAVLLLTLGRF